MVQILELSKSEISSIKPFSVAVQSVLCQTWSENPDRFSRDAAYLLHDPKLREDIHLNSVTAEAELPETFPSEQNCGSGILP